MLDLRLCSLSFLSRIILCSSLEERDLMIFNFSHTGIGRPETHTRGAGVELLDYEKRVDNDHRGMLCICFRL